MNLQRYDAYVKKIFKAPTDIGYGMHYEFCDACKSSDVARLEGSHAEMLEALEYAVKIYGKFGSVVNEPFNPGEWIEKAKTAITNAKDLNQP